MARIIWEAPDAVIGDLSKFSAYVADFNEKLLWLGDITRNTTVLNQLDINNIPILTKPMAKGGETFHKPLVYEIAFPRPMNIDENDYIPTIYMKVVYSRQRSTISESNQSASGGNNLFVHIYFGHEIGNDGVFTSPFIHTQSMRASESNNVASALVYSSLYTNSYIIKTDKSFILFTNPMCKQHSWNSPENTPNGFSSNVVLNYKGDGYSTFCIENAHILNSYSTSYIDNINGLYSTLTSAPTSPKNLYNWNAIVNSTILYRNLYMYKQFGDILKIDNVILYNANVQIAAGDIIFINGREYIHLGKMNVAVVMSLGFNVFPAIDITDYNMDGSIGGGLTEPDPEPEYQEPM